MRRRGVDVMIPALGSAVLLCISLVCKLRGGGRGGGGGGGGGGLFLLLLLSNWF